MAKEKTVSIKISLTAHAILKKTCEEKGYLIGVFADKAILEKVDAIRNSDKSKLK